MGSDQYNASQIIELRKISLEHTWKWFEFQANQRMVLFRYFLLIISAAIAAIVTLITKNQLLAVALLSIVGTFISILFWLIDLRIKFLINVGFDALEEDERYLATITGNEKIIFKTQVSKQSFSVSKLFLFLFLFFAVTFIVISIICFNSVLLTNVST